MKKTILFILMIVSIGIFVLAWPSYLNDYNLAYFRLNEVAGTNARDSVNGIYNATNINSVAINQLGKIGTSYKFDGVNDYLNLTKPTFACIPDKNCTIAMWINTTKNSDSLYYAGNGSSAVHPFVYLYTESGTGRLQFQTRNSDNAIQLFYTTSNVSTGTWNHVAVVMNVSSVLLYVNGLMVNQSVSTQTLLNNNNANIEIIGGFAPEVADVFDGLIDEIGIWNRSLNDSEIQKLYNNGNGDTLGSGLVTNITLTSPLNRTIIGLNNITFNASIMGTGNATNTTIYIFYQNGSKAFIGGNQSIDNINSVYNISLSGGDYLWSEQVCALSSDSYTFCAIDGNNTFAVGFSVIGEFWKNTTGEGDNALFQLNVSIPSGKTISSAKLIYNNTEYSASVNQIAGNNYSLSKNLILDTINSNVNMLFYWNISLASTPGSFTSNAHTQALNTIDMFSCTTDKIMILNYSIKDEDLLTYANGLPDSANISIYAQLISMGTSSTLTEFNKTFYIVNATTPARVCITGEVLNQTNYRLDVTTSYVSANHVLEYHNIQNHTLNNNSVFTDIPLLNLGTTRSQQFLITYKDANFIPVNDALIEIKRQYLGLGSFLTIEIPKTDNDGRSVASLVLNDEIYTIYVYKNGRLLSTYPNVRAFCSNTATGDCRINLNQASSGNQLNTISQIYNTTYGLEYSQLTRTITLDFSTIDGSTKFFQLNVTRFDNYLNDTLCSTSVTSSSGSISCTIPSSTGNISVVAKGYIDGSLLTTAIFNLEISKPFIRTAGTYFLAFLLVIFVPLLAFTSGSGMLIFFALGIIISSVLILLDLGGFIGTTSVFIWIIIAICILLWKINHRSE